jgi:hypothetical protein
VLVLLIAVEVVAAAVISKLIFQTPPSGKY